MKNHLAQTHKDFKPCLKVPDDIILPKFWKNLKNKWGALQLDDYFDVECLQEEDLQNVSSL